MQLNRKKFATKLDGDEVTLEISELAGQANGAVIGHHGDTVVLATVVMGNKETSTDYFPLTVDYEERFYAAGKILGSRFVRREGKASDEATLSARLIDRTIRPLFDPRLRREVQVTITVLSYDELHDPDAVALLAASAALAISDIPWNGPVAGVPFVEKNDDGSLRSHAFFAGPKGKVNMIELEGVEIAEEKATELFMEGQRVIDELVSFQERIAKEIGKTKIEISFRARDEETVRVAREFLKRELPAAVKEKRLEEVRAALVTALATNEATAAHAGSADEIFEEAVDAYVREEVMARNERPDSRKLDEVRDLYAEVGLLRRTHGSALFMRGNTQVLAVTTLASPGAEQLIETMETQGKQRFMLHYNFPGFSTGEAKRARGPGRREIGHGNLAAKAVRNLIPSKSEFPYTIRVVAETLSSNGSSSMATACATILALMDAGVPVKKHVAGIAMGLMTDDKGNFKILTDIQGPEDHYGDMDLKVAGTADGVTAIQMDTKIEGITDTIFKAALADAKQARLHILKTVRAALAAPRPELSSYAPRILTLTIPEEKIGLVIGPGGKTINGMVEAAGGDVEITVEDDGSVFIASVNAAHAKTAYEMVANLTKEYKLGDVVEGPIIKILEFGAIVDLGGGRDGMIHVSELRDGFVPRVEDVVRVGDHVRAAVVRVEDGRIALSLKRLKEQ
ncbi:MAG: polyribonucleotide nucleotidyltransferase [Candidatus Brennerbacteria bacterium]|nr:polyribonucleotide nucleotidyltransferase [Candidatus Brennerbacteria bacterium]